MLPKPDGLSSRPRTYVVEGENRLLEIIFSFPPTTTNIKVSGAGKLWLRLKLGPQPVFVQVISYEQLLHVFVCCGEIRGRVFHGA